MRVPLYQHVLFKDLQQYLRRDQYLDGYDEREKAYIRRNLGLDNIKASTQSTELSYNDLRLLIRDKQLNPGSVYIINDFRTIYQSKEKVDDKYVSYGKDVHPSDIYQIVSVAATEERLFPQVLILGHELWEVKYDATQQILDDGQKTMGRIYYLSDENNNTASYDFKNVLINTTDGLKYTFDKDGSENSQNCSNNNIINCNNVVFLDDCKNNVIYGNNIVVKHKLCNFVGTLNNTSIEEEFDDDTIKQSVLFNGIYYIDYLDLETLTHQFYATTNTDSIYISQ